jgi:hypothetical protein
VVALLLVALALAARGYRPRDPDSVLYARIGAELAERPVPEWIAPLWPSGEYMQGLYREHPAGIFVPSALLARAGYPAPQAAYALNAVYQVLALLLAQRVATALVDAHEARALLWVLQLLPVAFTYRARANQEQAVLLCLLLALVGVEASRRSRRYWLATAGGLVGLLLVKGVFVAAALLACGAWAWLRRREPGSTRTWAGLGIALAAVVAVAFAYEAAYRAATGESFLHDYLPRQVSSGMRNPIGSLAATGGNLAWYAARLLWFAFPWSLVAVLALPTFSRDTTAGRAPGVALAASLVLAYLLPMSFMQRRAERYIFPAFFVLGAAGALLARRRSEPVRRLALRLEAPYAPQLLFVLLLLLHLAGSFLGWPRIKLG